MEVKRKTGIEPIGNVPWGTHFPQFYHTREDLLDILVPYFKAGLENNEFCMWVTSEPLNEEEAKEAMRKIMPDLDQYLQTGQIEILPHTEWYLKNGLFNSQTVLDSWIDKLNQAMAKGFDGLRLTGNTSWLEKKDWKDFIEIRKETKGVQYRLICKIEGRDVFLVTWGFHKGSWNTDITPQTAKDRAVQMKNYPGTYRREHDNS